MKKRIVAVLASLLITFGSIANVNAQSSNSGASGGMSVGTAVAIGVVGAALLVALGDSSSSAPAAVSVVDDAGEGASNTPVAETTTGTTGT